jgi:hypothetical protein
VIPLARSAKMLRARVAELPNAPRAVFLFLFPFILKRVFAAANFAKTQRSHACSTSQASNQSSSCATTHEQENAALFASLQ